VIAALSMDPSLIRRSGQVVIAAQAAMELGVVDVEGKQPVALTLESV